MASGKIVYPSGDPSPSTYVFAKNCDYGHEQGYVETDNNKRTIDGTLKSYAGAVKKVFNLSFSYVGKAQRDTFWDLWTFQCEIDLYLDGTNLDAIVKMMGPPTSNSEPAFVNGDYTYSFDVVFEEV